MDKLVKETGKEVKEKKLTTSDNNRRCKNSDKRIDKICGRMAGTGLTIGKSRSKAETIVSQLRSRYVKLNEYLHNTY